MLAFNKEVISERIDKELEKLQHEIIIKIKEIENAKEFPTKVTSLCNCCGFRNICPSFKHKVELETKEKLKDFKEDDGVKFVDGYAEIKSELSELQEKQEELKIKLIEFAKQKQIDVIYGSNMKASVKEFDKIVMPEDGKDKESFINLIKDKGIYEECSMICYPKLNSKVLKGEVKDEDVMNKLSIEKDFRINLSKRKDGEREE
jgi:hypothetical protein